MLQYHCSADELCSVYEFTIMLKREVIFVYAYVPRYSQAKAYSLSVQRTNICTPTLSFKLAN